MHRAAPILALYLAACGSHESDAPPTPPPTRDEAPDETPEPPESPDEAETDEPSIGALVRLGRAHFRERRFAEAAASFDRALARNPGDGGLSCETGWAFHHAGDDAKARQLLQHGTRLLASREDRKRSYGACLYNLGRMAEDAGQDEAAARLYATSLRARPNRIVQRRLDALEVDLEAERPLYGTVHDAVDGAEGLTGENRDDMLYYVRDLDTRAHALPPRPPVLEVATVSYGEGGRVALPLLPADGATGRGLGRAGRARRRLLRRGGGLLRWRLVRGELHRLGRRAGRAHPRAAGRDHLSVV